MVVLVPVEEVRAVPARVFDRAEAVGEVGPVLQRLEVRLAVRALVRDVRSRVRLRDAQVGKQERDGLRRHRRSTVCVQRELTGLDALARTGLRDEPVGKHGGLAMRHHPADDIATEDVEHHVRTRSADHVLHPAPAPS